VNQRPALLEQGRASVFGTDGGGTGPTAQSPGPLGRSPVRGFPANAV